jgi:hypothetical protein
MPWATTHDGNNLWDIMLKIMLVIGLSFFYNNYQTTINFQHHTLNLSSPFLLAHGSIGNFDVPQGVNMQMLPQNLSTTYMKHLYLNN